MCGIAGILSSSGKAPDADAVKRMIAMIRHRGPDGDGYFADGPLALGSCRLSIIDLQGGSQPMFSESGDICTVYNGEIYNYRELTEDLKGRGHVFATKSDTEVIVHSWEEWGTDCVLRFNGMFAFALWDVKKGTLFVARDRLGIKPLYLAEGPWGLAFASEIKAFLAIPGFSPELNNYALADFLMYQNILDEKTFFNGVTKLLPGQSLCVSGDGDRRLTQYWDAVFDDYREESFDDLLERYRETFAASVRRHLISDVPVGCHLSGGFDSAGLASMAKRITGEPPVAFTGYFSEHERYDERKLSSLVADRLGSTRREIHIRPEDFSSNLKRTLYHLDEPSVGSSALPHFMVSGEISRHVKVVLTGHGGDELFAGYQVCKSVYGRQLLKTNPLSALSVLGGLKASEIPRAAYFFFYPWWSPDVGYGLYILSSLKGIGLLCGRDFLRGLGDYNPRDSVRKLVDGRGFSPVERTTYLYLRTFLATLLTQEDKTSMAFSVESRTPICDNEMTGFSLGTRMHHKLHNNELKAIPKYGLRDILPAELYGAPKMGFPDPISIWFRNDLKDFVRDTLLDSTAVKMGIFKRGYLSSLLDRFYRFRTCDLYDYYQANRIYSLLSVELWLRIFMEGGWKEFAY